MTWTVLLAAFLIDRDKDDGLDVQLNKNLDLTDNTQTFSKKKRGQSWLHLLRRLRSLGVREGLLKTFNDSVLASANFYGVGLPGATEKKKLDKSRLRLGLQSLFHESGGWQEDGGEAVINLNLVFPLHFFEK